jgi:hypothetical protein
MKRLMFFLITFLAFASFTSVYSMNAKPPRVVEVEDCGDGTYATQTYLDMDGDGKYDHRADRDCSGSVKLIPLVIVEASGSDPIPVDGPVVVSNYQCQSGDVIYSVSFLDDNQNVICIAERPCDVDTVYVVVPLMQSVESTNIDLRKEKIDIVYINNNANKILFGISSIISGKGKFTISDINGNILLSEVKPINQSSNKIVFDNILLSTGVYFLTVEVNNLHKTCKFIISE